MASSAVPVTDWPAHGDTARLRRQPVRMVEGRAEGGYTDLFELICPSCGDHPYLNYSQVSPQLQRLRGPLTLAAGLAAYEEHLAQTSGRYGLPLRPSVCVAGAGMLVSSVRSGSSSSAPARKNTAPTRVPRFARSALRNWPVAGLM
jgi:hypothetical protein